MKVIVDTCIWSLALRRKVIKTNEYVVELEKLVSAFRVQLIGPIRQEILSGIKDTNHFIRLKRYLSTFIDLPVTTMDYENAAEFGNVIRRKSVQGSPVDLLICALAFRHKLPLFTVDADFINYQKYIPFDLYEIQVKKKKPAI